MDQERASGGALTEVEAERTSRQRALPFVGDVGQRRLAAARVLIVGAGGLAHPAAQYLAGSGVGRLDLVDDDVVEFSNLARQLSFTVDDLGRPKVAALAAALERVAPASTIVGHGMRVDDRVASDLIIRLAPDVVIDTTDDWDARFAVADACRSLGIPLVWASVIGTDGQLTVFPGRPGEPGVDDLVDRTTARRNPVSCADEGVLGSLCGQVGAMAATEAIKLLLGAGEPLVGRLAVIDALAATVREVPLQSRAARKVVSGERRRARSTPVAPIAPAVHVAQAVPRVSPDALPAAGDVAGEARGDAPTTLPIRTPGTGAAHPTSTPTPATSATAAARVATPPRAQLVTIDELVADPLGTVLVDVRQPHGDALPWPPAGLELVEVVRAPLESLATSIDRGALPLSIERASRVVVTCSFGPRARHAAAMLRAAGVPGVVVLDEGTGGLRAAFERSEREVVRG